MKSQPESSVPLKTLLHHALISGGITARNVFFQACYDKLAKKIFITAYGFFPYQADDVVADIFVKIIQVDLERFPVEDEGYLENYILRIAYHHCVDQYHRDKNKAVSSLHTTEGYLMIAPCMTHQQSMVDMDLNFMLDALTPGQSRVLKLWYQGFPYQDIADQLGLTLEAVKNRIYRARKLLKSNFQPL